MTSTIQNPPHNFVDELQSRIHFANFYPHGKSTGPNQIIVNCPFHDDKHASMSINTGTGVYYCHSCGEKGNFLTWCKKQNIDLQKLAADHGIQTEQKKISKEEVTRAHQKLLSDESALKWLQDSRGINLETVTKYQLGLKGQIIIIPIYDINNNLVNIRKYNRNAKNGEPKFTSWKSGYGSARLFPIQNLYKETILICEGEMDCLLANQLGYNAVTGTAGAKTFPIEWMRYFSGKKVLICYDIDEAGMSGAKKVAKLLSKHADAIKIINLPLDKDKYPNGDFTDYIVVEGHTKEDLKYIFKQSPLQKIKPTNETESFTPNETQILPPDEDDQRSFNLTDMGNAERLENQFYGDAKYDHEVDAWFIWNDQRWEKDETGNIYRLAKVVVRSIYGEASEVEDDIGRKRIVGHGLRSENKRAIDAMINLGKNEERLAVMSDYFNQNPLLFNLQNGTYDFGKMEFREHRKSDRITMMSKFNYAKDTEHEKWDEFLNVVFGENQEIIDFVQMIIGYSLTGKVDVDKLFFCYGCGDNGKTTFFEPIKVLLGDYFQRIASETLMWVRTQSRDPANSNITDLKNKRFALISEVRNNMPLDENMLKQLVGGDEIRARAQYQTGFNFNPTHKLWMYGNDKPKIRVTDPGTWRRICLIPFTVQIPPEIKRERSEVISELLEELPGIFNWAIVGYEKYLEKGFIIPPDIRKASNIYKMESDLLQQFIEECTEVGDKVTLKNLHLSYEYFMKENQEKQLLGKRKFRKELETKQYIFFNGTNNTVFCEGVTLTDEYEEVINKGN